MAAAIYSPLKTFVERRGGMRLAVRGALRDRLVEMAVEEFPSFCPIDRLEEVLGARMRIRVRENYGSIVATFLISVLVNWIAHLVVEWFKERHSHRMLMEGWIAKARPDLSSPVAEKKKPRG